MSWDVFYHPAFSAELRKMDPLIRASLLALFEVVEMSGPQLGRPMADHLKGSRHANMKELRVMVSGDPGRVAFVFDPLRRAIILVAGNKSGQSLALFYRRLIREADKRYDEHVRSIGR